MPGASAKRPRENRAVDAVCSQWRRRFFLDALRLLELIPLTATKLCCVLPPITEAWGSNCCKMMPAGVGIRDVPGRG